MIGRAAFWIVGVCGWAFGGASCALWIWLLAHRADNYEADVARNLEALAEQTRAADERASEAMRERDLLRGVVEGDPELERRVAELRAKNEADRRAGELAEHLGVTP